MCDVQEFRIGVNNTPAIKWVLTDVTVGIGLSSYWTLVHCAFPC